MDIKSFIYMLNNASPDELKLIRNIIDNITPQKKKIIPPEYSKFSDTPWLDDLSEEQKLKITTSKRKKEYWFRELLKEYFSLSIEDKFEYINQRIKLININSQNPFMILRKSNIIDMINIHYENYKEKYIKIKNDYLQKYKDDPIKMSKFEVIYSGLIDELNTILVNIEVIIFHNEKYI